MPHQQVYLGLYFAMWQPHPLPPLGVWRDLEEEEAKEQDPPTELALAVRGRRRTGRRWTWIRSERASAWSSRPAPGRPSSCQLWCAAWFAAAPRRRTYLVADVVFGFGWQQQAAVSCERVEGSGHTVHVAGWSCSLVYEGLSRPHDT